MSLLLALFAIYLADVADLPHSHARWSSRSTGWPGEVARWDPRAARCRMRSPRSDLPADAGIEVQAPVAGLARAAPARSREFVQRERDFTRDASHELRTPLTVIRVATDLMLGDPETTPRAQRSLTRIQRAGRDMEAVIDAFLILAREGEVDAAARGRSRCATSSTRRSDACGRCWPTSRSSCW